MMGREAILERSQTLRVLVIVLSGEGHQGPFELLPVGSDSKDLDPSHGEDVLAGPLSAVVMAVAVVASHLSVADGDTDLVVLDGLPPACHESLYGALVLVGADPAHTPSFEDRAGTGSSSGLGHLYQVPQRTGSYKERLLGFTGLYFELVEGGVHTPDYRLRSLSLPFSET